MITRVLLRNWRGYEKLSLDLGPGLTFVIADNGVGKTSLVNGVAWAIFGEEAGIDADAAIRAGAEATQAEVDFEVGSATFTVTRSRRRTGRPREQLTVEHDGGALPPGELLPRLAELADVPVGILPQLMFVPEMRLTHEGELFADVQDHLAALLGIDELQTASRRARAIEDQAVGQVREALAVARVDAAAHAAAQQRRQQIGDELAQLDSAIQTATAERDQVAAAIGRHEQWADHDRRLDRHQERLAELFEQAEAAGTRADPDAVDQAAHSAAEDLRRLDADLTAAHTEHAVVEGLLDQLQEAEAVCPVCLRPVDRQVARTATAAHRQHLAALQAREADVEQRLQEVEAAARTLRTVAAALARQHPPAPPDGPRPDDAHADLVQRQVGLDSTIADAASGKGALGEQLRQLDLVLEQAERSDQATGELVRHQAVAAAAAALAQLARDEADARTERALDPISHAIGERWAEFFVASAARPRLAGGGSIELGREGASIPYASFSGGEKTLASLLTRLLFVTAATGLHSMWLDEPLEHLDPANRTRVARLLAQATRPGSHMRQLVVTTYEEGLARSMVGRHDANLVYVSTDELL